jgi:hypothetical protein
MHDVALLATVDLAAGPRPFYDPRALPAVVRLDRAVGSARPRGSRSQRRPFDERLDGEELRFGPTPAAGTDFF